MIQFEIKKGENLRQITQKLYQQQLIPNEITFRLYGKLNNLESKVIAGRFPLKKSMTPSEIFSTITKHSQEQTIIIINEGLTSHQIDQKLVAAGLINSGEFITALKEYQGYQQFPFIHQKTQQKLIIPLEGYLFPDTYFVDPSSFSTKKFITTLLKNFETKALPTITAAQSDRSLHQNLTMASIVEHEAKGNHDAAIIADILWKRLDYEWFIGADATLLYLKGNRSINYQDLKKDSPYNTRNRKGLPPGPIGNPGISSIKGSIYSEPSDYWYYLHAPSGETHYAKTNNEHNRNKAKYLQ